ncbi:MAG: amidohydrolase family protein [Myxococcota bacterium]|nr:amidohydrolase family protein [Myxococcota bacterium]
MGELPFSPFDADNHYYEHEDAFTRHVDRRMQKRAVEWVERNGRRRILVAGKLDKFIPNPTFDPVTKPGVLEDYFRGVNPEGKSMAELFMGNIEPIRPSYRDRDARLAVLDEQGLEAALLFPTLGCGIEQPLSHDPEATHAALHGFNQWLHEDWGFAYKERLFGVPMLSLADTGRAVEQLEWVLERGARVVYLRPAPVPKGGGRTTSPGDPEHDPFWARIAEAGVTVAFHTGDTGYYTTSKWESPRQMEGFRGGFLLGMMTQQGRYIMDTLAALIAHGVFRRFPNVRVATVECGAFWVPWLFKNMEKAYGQMPELLAEDPRDTFRRHVWVAPFFEDDIRGLVDLIGADHVLFGSDFPHAEGLQRPLDFLKDLEGFSEGDVRRIMRDNARFITTPRPASEAESA